MKTKESQTADLQEILKVQQEETSKAKEKLKGALADMEQLKEGFKTERTNWEIEKAVLLKWAEDAEATLKPVTEELTGLKRQINAMTSAIFGKYCLPMLYEHFALECCRFNLKFVNRYRWPHCSAGL